MLGNSGGTMDAGSGGGVFGACNGSVPSRSKPGTPPTIIAVRLPLASIEPSLGGGPTSCPSCGGWGGGPGSAGGGRGGGGGSGIFSGSGGGIKRCEGICSSAGAGAGPGAAAAGIAAPGEPGTTAVGAGPGADASGSTPVFCALANSVQSILPSLLTSILANMSATGFAAGAGAVATTTPPGGCCLSVARKCVMRELASAPCAYKANNQYVNIAASEGTRSVISLLCFIAWHDPKSRPVSGLLSQVS